MNISRFYIGILHGLVGLFNFLSTLHRQYDSCDYSSVFTARAYARAVLGVVILSVCPSVRQSVRLSHACIVTKLNDALRIF